MNNNNKWFSLIEVVIATWIITISVFWVYKLIWENTKIINISSNILQQNSLVWVLKECIRNIEFWTYIIWQEHNFNLWANLDECLTWTINKVIVDNIEFELKWKIMEVWTEYIIWEYLVNNWLSYSLTWTFVQIKN